MCVRSGFMHLTARKRCRRYLRLKYHPALKHVALEVSVKGHRVKINDMSYISAPLRPKCSGWHPEWGKAWESWGAPNYVS